MASRVVLQMREASAKTRVPTSALKLDDAKWKSLFDECYEAELARIRREWSSRAGEPASRDASATPPPPIVALNSQGPGGLGTPLPPATRSPCAPLDSTDLSQSPQCEAASRSSPQLPDATDDVPQRAAFADLGTNMLPTKASERIHFPMPIGGDTIVL